MQLFEKEVDRTEIGVLAIYMVILPVMVLISLALSVADYQDVFTALFCGIGAVSVYYLSLRVFKTTSHVAVAFGIASLLLSVFFSTIMFNSTDVNPFEYYSAYLGPFYAWAVPTIMWQETRWFLEGDEEHSQKYKDLIESLGFLVALIYTMLYILIDLHGVGSDSASAMFLGLLVVWVILRFLLP